MRFLGKLLLAVLLDALIVLIVIGAYQWCFSKEAREARVHALYSSLVAQTGQSQDALPLIIVESDVENAYNNGQMIVIYTAITDNYTWDEIALILGHEIAHGMLGHLNHQMPVPEGNSEAMLGANGFIAVLEGNADKMGAVYMMKAGYDVCAGREIYKKWLHKKGNYIGQSHPNYSYRYAELNINCGEV
jgi:predicted Zn-dependent protease